MKRRPAAIYSFLALLGMFSGLARAQEYRAAPPTGSLQGKITFTNQQGDTSPLGDVQITLTAQAKGIPPLSGVTDDEGRYEFTALRDGIYTLKVGADGFEELTQSIEVAQGAAVRRDFVLRVATVVQSIEVHDRVDDIQTGSASSAATVTSKEISDLPLLKQNMTAALAAPMVPSIVQTANKILNVKGSSETHGMLLVDSMQTVDPATGRFVVPVPLNSIQTVSTMETAYNAQYGGFSGGLTKIQTKPPLDHWQFSLNDFMPGFRGKNGVLRGLADEAPEAIITGPLVKGKLNFSEALAYQFDRPTVRGLPWPYNETITRGRGSMTTAQLLLSDRHLLSLRGNIFTHGVQFANINALLPQRASVNDGQHGYWLGATDSYQFVGGTLLNTLFRYTRVDTNADSQGSAPMLITPNGWDGNYFNSWVRAGDQTQVLSSVQLPIEKWHGRHEVIVGVDFSRRSYTGVSRSHAIQLLDESGLLQEQIDFEGAGLLHGGSVEVSEFVHDHWSATDHLTFDVGARLTSQATARVGFLAPRAGVAYSPGNDQKTVIRSGIGLFYDRVPLLAPNFTNNLTRVISTFDETGQLTGQPMRYVNRFVEPTAGGGFAPIDSLTKFARNLTWNVELDRSLRRDLQVRLSYLQSRTRDLAVVVPLSPSTLTRGEAVLGLASSGISNYQGLEANLRYEPTRRQQFNVSYLHSSARGDLNSLASIYVPFEGPVIRANVQGILPSDVPNRVVAWGTFGLPLSLTISPLVDLHTGLPYSVVDALQNYVGTPNTSRLPRYFSMDMQVYREFPLSSFPMLHRAKNRTLRIGILSFDLTGHKNPNAVFNTLTSSHFGHFTGMSRRIDGFIFEFH